MSEAWILRDTNRDTERELDSRSEAENSLEDLVGIGANRGDLEIIPPGKNGNEEIVIDDDDGDTDDWEVGDNGTPAAKTAQPNGVPQPSQLTSDPLDVISKNADQFTDTIQGTTTINRQGYAVLAERFGISVTAEPVTLASSTDFEYAEFKAVAETENGETYTGFGSAHVNRDTGDSACLLNELAETRAMKRSCAWATGVGMTAVEELEAEVEG